MSRLLRQLNQELENAVEKARPSLVQISNGRGAGAGTIWHPEGLILTNAHITHRHRNLQATLPDGRRLPARLLAEDTDRDLAALAVDATQLATIKLGQSQTLQPGQWVVAIGHPWGVLGAVTAGVVIDTGPPSEQPFSNREFIQVGLHLRPGHSGGPLVDSSGRLVGINTMMAGPDVGLAVPLHVVKAFLRQRLGSQEMA